MTQRAVSVVLPLLVLAVVLWGCDNDTSNDIVGPGGAPQKSCLGCHSSEAALKAALGSTKAVVAVANKDDG